MIETFAGSGEEGFGGDEGPALEASFAFPRSVAVDSAGSVYVADTRNHRIRKIDAAGKVSTFAGTGARRWWVDNDDEGAQASEVELHFPTSVAADAADNIYLLDTWHHQIRMIDTTGAISTVAGTGASGFRGDGGTATTALLDSPTGMAIDSAGNIYVADSSNHRIRKIDSAGIISTVAGTGRRGFAGDGGPAARAYLAYPSGVAADASGNIYIADSWNHRIRKVNSSGSISTIAGIGEVGDNGDGGPALNAQLAYPAAVAADRSGSVYVIAYVPETGNHRVRQIDATGRISAFAGSAEEGFRGDGGPAREALLAYPTGVCADASGVVYLTDSLNARIRVIRPGSQVTVPLGESGESVALVVSQGGVLTRGGVPVLNGFKLAAGNGNEYSLTAEPGGAFVATYLPQEQRISLAGSEVTVTSQEDGTWRIGQVRVENGHKYSHGGREYVLELLDGTWGLAPYVVRTVAGSTEVDDGIPAVEASLNDAWGLTVDTVGNLYVAEAGNDRVRMINPSGIITTIAGTGNWGFRGDGGEATAAELWDPFGLASDAFGNVYVADHENYRVRRIDPSGTIVTIAGTGQSCCYRTDGTPASETSLEPWRLAADSAGNLYVTGRSRVYRIDASGTTVAIAGTGRSGYGGDGGQATLAGISYRTGVAVDRVGRVYIADTNNHRVRRIDASGTITTVAGTGRSGYSGDGGLATSAELDQPYDVAVSQLGTVYIADYRNGRVRTVDASGTIKTVAGKGGWSYGGDGGPAIEAAIGGPRAVELDRAGNLYVLDRSNRVRKIDASQTITTIAGTGTDLDGHYEIPSRSESARFQGPTGVALDFAGNVLFRDGRRVFRVDSMGSLSVFAGSSECCYAGDGGRATEARIGTYPGLATDTTGNTYLAEGLRVRRIDRSGVITTIAGTGTRGYGGDGGAASEAQFGWAYGVATDTVGNLYVADHGNHRIRKIDRLGRITTIAGTGDRGYSGDGGPAVAAQLEYPAFVTADRAGNVYVARRYVGRIRVVDSSGVIRTLANLQDGIDSLALDRSGNLLVGGGNRIYRVAVRDGTLETIAGTGEPGFIGDGGPARSAHLSAGGLAEDRSGNIWFADQEGRRLRVLERQSNSN